MPAESLPLSQTGQTDAEASVALGPNLPAESARLLDPLNILALPSLSRHFADLMLRCAGQDTDQPWPAPLWLAAFALSEASRRQQSCLDLEALAGQPVAEQLALDRLPPGFPTHFPLLTPWLAALAAAPAVVTEGQSRTPLVLRGKLLYLYRYWHYEQQLAHNLAARMNSSYTPPADAAEQLARLFGAASQTAVDWQQVAVASALLNPLTLISGGPGTGKTTTVARLLALLLSSQPELRVVLTAPTGKAAARMKQALDKSRSDLLARGVPADLLARFPKDAMTLHRLLGYQPGRIDFRHHQDKPLPWDVVILDEASMVDLALMAKLLDAVASDTRLILLGDKDQLASVEAGAVLGDLCRQAAAQGFTPARRQLLLELTGAEPTALGLDDRAFSDAVIGLSHSHRFDARSGIGRLAFAVRDGAQAEALAVLDAADQQEVSLRPLPARWDALQDELLSAFAPYLHAGTPGDALERLEAFMLLTALRRGPYGAEALNRQLSQSWCQRAGLSPRQPFYHRRPILITANDYTHQLYNGDIGVVWRLPGEAPRVHFRRADGTIKSFSPAQLGAHESAWALTVHKSQGSEFDRVWLVLPPEVHPLVTRELVYTGLTRARQQATLFGSQAVLSAAIETRVQRPSGLADALAAALS
ncbi:MAG: exodeoxyribonuclease V subunit alpha [Candidatus Sericytochromatia bacterium]|nr:exodeoxyribonuclease V subunit alpha [Candidatus Sericytochromatia bacterium]